jgi:hypothetical protein
MDTKSVPANLRLTRAALAEFKIYLQQNPRVRAFERQETGVDPLAHPIAYLRVELREPEHADVLCHIVSKYGAMGVSEVRRWAAVNRAKVSGRVSVRDLKRGAAKRLKRCIEDNTHTLPLPRRRRSSAKRATRTKK